MKNCISKILHCQLTMSSLPDYFVCYSEPRCPPRSCGSIPNQHDWPSLTEELDVLRLGQVEVTWFS